MKTYCIYIHLYIKHKKRGDNTILDSLICIKTNLQMSFK